MNRKFTQAKWKALKIILAGIYIVIIGPILAFDFFDKNYSSFVACFVVFTFLFGYLFFGINRAERLGFEYSNPPTVGDQLKFFKLIFGNPFILIIYVITIFLIGVAIVLVF
jgi:hypothetical protein